MCKINLSGSVQSSCCDHGALRRSIVNWEAKKLTGHWLCWCRFHLKFIACPVPTGSGAFADYNGEHCAGDDITMGEVIGAKSVDLHRVQVHPAGLVKPDDATDLMHNNASLWHLHPS